MLSTKFQCLDRGSDVIYSGLRNVPRRIADLDLAYPALKIWRRERRGRGEREGRGRGEREREREGGERE